MKKILMIAVLIPIFGISFSQNTWVELPGFAATEADTYPIAASGDELYVSKYISETGTNAKLVMLSFKNGNWSQVGDTIQIEGAAYRPSSIKINNGIIYALFNVNYDAKQRPTLLKYDGTSWKPVGKELFVPQYYFAESFAIINNAPYVIGSDSKYKSKATVYTFQNNQWKEFGEPGFSKDQPYGSGIFAYGDKVATCFFTDDYNVRNILIWNGKEYDAISKGGCFSKDKVTNYKLDVSKTDVLMQYSYKEAKDLLYLFKYNGKKWNELPATNEKVRYAYSTIHNDEIILIYEDATKGNNIYMKTLKNDKWSVGKPISKQQIELIGTCKSDSGIFITCTDASKTNRVFFMKY